MSRASLILDMALPILPALTIIAILGHAGSTGDLWPLLFVPVFGWLFVYGLDTLRYALEIRRAWDNLPALKEIFERERRA